MRTPHPSTVPATGFVPIAASLFVASVPLVTAPVVAQTVVSQALPPVTVSATRERRSVDETTSTVTVIPAEEIEERFVKDIRDLVRNEPGIAVRRAPTRFGAALGSTGRDGNAGFNVRGLDGNRVLLQVDGIRLPAGFSFGASNFGRGGYTDVSTLQSVEILRGPASSLYGSDGLAGVVSFFTVDPIHLLGDKAGYASIATSYASEDRSQTVSLAGATRASGTATSGLELLGIATGRFAKELDNAGTVDASDARRTKPNPQRADTGALLLKAVQRFSRDAQVRLTLDHSETRTETDVRSARATPPLAPTSVVRLDAVDDLERTRASLDGSIERLGFALADRVQAAVYWQDSRTRQQSFEDRNTAADRIRDNRYSERLLGINSQFDKSLATGPLQHRIVYGADHATARIDNVRTGTVPPAGETFPTKAFPRTDYETLGLFLQDEIALGSTGVFVTPALRYDDYALKPKDDPLFQSGGAVTLKDDRVTPKLAVRWRASDAFTAYVNYAKGFRAPTPDQVNNGFTNLTSPGFAYRSLGNPDLRPETSRTVEAGARFSAGGFRSQLAWFDGDYENFIAQTTVGGTGTPANPVLFQFVNFGEVSIRGWETRAEYRFSPAWRVEAAYARAKGDVKTSGLPLNSVQPPKLFAGVWWNGGPVSATASVNHVQAKKRDAIDSSGLPAGQQQFATPSFTTVDLAVNWNVTDRIAIGVGVFNVLDKKLWAWSDVQGVSDGSPVLDAYTQPGRSYAVRAKFTF